MTNIWAVASKDLRTYFVSPVAYVVLAGFLVLSGWFFWNLLAQFSRMVTIYSSFQRPDIMEQLNLNDMVVMPLLQNMVVIFIILIPLLTMRLFAQERSQGTDELLLTCPISTLEITFGKFLGATLLLVIMLGCASIYPLVLAYYGNPEIGPILTGYLGLLLVGMSFVAVGLFASTLTDNQIVAAVTAFVILLLFFVIGWPADAVGNNLGAVLQYLSVTEHLQDLTRGLVKSQDIIYYVSLIILGLFLTQRSLESLRWR